MPRAGVLLIVCLLASSACDASTPSPVRTGPTSSSSPVTSTPSLVPVSASPSTSPRPGRLQLAFACGRFICRAQPDGRDRRRLTRGREASDGDPSWSPDGSQIAFGRKLPDGASGIFVVNSDGTGLRPLTSDPAPATQPEWSPDGKRIAFTTERDGNSEVYVMNADGGHPVNLSGNQAKDSGPTWSPDGKRIAYTSNRDGKPEVYVVEADGSRTTRLTISEGSSSPTWSPEGSRVVLMAVGIGLALVDLRSGTVSPITTGATDAHPRWSPVGDLVAFERGKPGRIEIHTVRPDGKGLRRVTHDRDTDRDPSWGLVPA
jgi:tol-pal system beta propeller repeat protein TolB